ARADALRGPGLSRGPGRRRGLGAGGPGAEPEGTPSGLPPPRSPEGPAGGLTRGGADDFRSCPPDGFLPPHTTSFSVPAVSNAAGQPAQRKWRVRSVGMTDVGRRRDHNEDSFLIDEDLQVYVVADGMGGHAGGGTASRIAVETIDS